MITMEENNISEYERDKYIHLYESTLKDLDIAVKNKIELENIRKKAIEFINEWLFEAGGNGADMDYDTIVDLLNILNKGDNNVKDKR